MVSYREQLEEDLRYNEAQAALYRNGPPSRKNEILCAYFEEEAKRIKARLAEVQKEAAMKWG